MTNVTTTDDSLDGPRRNLTRVRELIDSSALIDLSKSNLSTQLLDVASWQDCVTLLESRSQGLLHIANSLVLRRMADAEHSNNIACYIESLGAGVYPLLRILGSSKREIPPAIVDAIVKVAHGSPNLICEAAARTVGFRAPSRIPDLLSRITPAIANGLSYSAQPLLLEPILQFWQSRPGSDNRYPPSLGFLVTPQWLARNAEVRPSDVGALALTFGYIDDRWFTAGDTIPSWVIGAWRIGMSYITPDLEQLDEEEIAELQRVSMKRVLPWISGMYSGTVPSGFSTEAVRAGILSAVRSFERENLIEKRDEPPFHPSKRDNVEWARFCHSPASRCRRQLISKPLEEARTQGIPEKYLDAYLAEHAVLLLELDRQTRREAELFFKARWQLVAESGLHPGPIKDFPVTEANSSAFPHLARLVLPKLPTDLALRKSPLSLGARAAAALLEYCNSGPSQQILLSIEEHQKHFLHSIGCEIQVPFSKSREAQALPWKIALRSFGIPSPYRPEYDKLVEGSFAPSWTYLAPIATILSLSKLGLFQEEPNIALHISIGADLGDKVGYLLFPQQFITTVRTGRYSPQLLSKGFACLHQDAYSPHQSGMSPSYSGIKPQGQGLVRTEIRSFRIPASTVLDATGEESFIEDIACNHLLASAARAEDTDLNSVWLSYCNDIDRCTQELPVIVRNMFHANWYECTGEPYDKNVMNLLPTYRRVVECMDWAISSGAFSDLQIRFTELRRKYALQLQDLVGLPTAIATDPRLFTSKNGFTVLRPVGGATPL